MGAYVHRHAERVVADALADTRVVIINGARQSGKSTLVHAVTAARPDVAERRLDRTTDLQAARRDPESFVIHRGLLVIDEIQRAPELILPIKARVDDSQRPGQFLLTGSARLLGLRTLPDALVGRSETIELWPFSQGEIENEPDGFVDAAFGPDDFEQDRPKLAHEHDRSEILTRSIRGGFPEAVARDHRRRSRWFSSYVNDLIDRDVTQLTDIQRRSDLDRLVRLLAARMATTIQIENMASVLGIPRTTLDRYIALFEEVFLIKRIPAWSASETGRAVRLRKLLFVDSGLAAHLSGRSLPRMQRDAALAGSLVENFVLGELSRQLTWSHCYARLYHYRDRDGREIDAILEHDDGRVVAIEVKATMTVIGDDFRHLAFLQKRIGDRFHHGIVLHTGDSVVPFGDRLSAVPLRALWTSAAALSG